MAKVSTIIDAFPGTSFSSFWYTFSANTTCNNELLITHPASSATYDGLVSQATYDATSSYSIAWLTNAGNQSLVSLEVYPVQWFLGGGANSNSQVAFYINQNSLSAAIDTGSGIVLHNTITYNANLHKYFMLKETGGTCYWYTSSDGQHFTLFYSVADPITLTSIVVQVFGGTYNSEASGTTLTWQSVGLYGPVGAAKVHKQSVKRAAYF